MDPVIFQIPGFTLGDLQIGPFPIRWYALAYVAGILIGWRYVVGIVRNPKLWERRGPPATDVQIDDLVLWITLGVIVGGRLGHVVFYTPDIIFTDPMEIVRVWNGGMSFHGGVLGVAAAMIAFSVRNKLDLFRLADLVAAAQPIGQFFGRIANFINGELWGRPTEVPWGMVFPHDPMGVPRHPSQLYEAALEGVLVFLILRWATHGKPKLLNRRGVVAGLFLVSYGLVRIAVETVREPDAYMPPMPLGLTMGMTLSAPMLLLGAWLIWRGMREPVPAEPAAVPAPSAAK
ncbi:MAG: prolipoprotein diacylglyceryl transferase [Phenylobacterium sp.]|nr:prolipoprotein diacylglyceryl transferase [Phenylobacterium sp.]MDX9997675.1 prolipoprotein diacylglyceryl transferase [Phenylobacterium sp.]